MNDFFLGKKIINNCSLNQRSGLFCQRSRLNLFLTRFIFNGSTWRTFTSHKRLRSFFFDSFSKIYKAPKETPSLFFWGLGFLILQPCLTTRRRKRSPCWRSSPTSSTATRHRLIPTMKSPNLLKSRRRFSVSSEEKSPFTRSLEAASVRQLFTLLKICFYVLLLVDCGTLLKNRLLNSTVAINFNRSSLCVSTDFCLFWLALLLKSRVWLLIHGSRSTFWYLIFIDHSMLLL